VAQPGRCATGATQAPQAETKATRSRTRLRLPARQTQGLVETPRQNRPRRMPRRDLSHARPAHQARRAVDARPQCGPHSMDGPRALEMRSIRRRHPLEQAARPDGRTRRCAQDKTALSHLVSIPPRTRRRFTRLASRLRALPHRPREARRNTAIVAIRDRTAIDDRCHSPMHRYAATFPQVSSPF
jgi:hypothetical protein